MPSSAATSYSVYDHIEAAILRGELKPGDQLPPERELAAQLGVSRSAAREAIRALQFQGVLASSVGHFGGTRVATMQTQALTRLLKLHVALADFPVDHVTELRIALERATATSAARSATSEQLEQMWAVVEAMDVSTLDQAAFNELDTSFHIAIAAASHNPLISDLTIAVRESLRTPIHDAEITMKSDWQSFSEQLRAQHRAVVEAIQARDLEAAGDAIDNHIRFAYAILSPRTGKQRWGDIERAVG